MSQLDLFHRGPRNVSKIHFSRTGYHNFDLKRLLSPHYSNDNQIHNQNMISIKIVVTNFHEKIRKIVINVHKQNSDDERCLQKYYFA